MTAATAPITIADYGMGNMRSVVKAFEHVGAAAAVSPEPAEIAAATSLVLPGVGAFPEAISEIDRRGLAGPIRARVADGVPLLGICLGMQLLFESSTEHGGAVGLGLLAGAVEPIAAPGLKLPHIGWSHLLLERESPLTAGIADGEPFYFVHSLIARPEPDELIAVRRARRAIRGRRRPGQRLRDPVPPREVERCGPADAGQLRGDRRRARRASRC